MTSNPPAAIISREGWCVADGSTGTSFWLELHHAQDRTSEINIAAARLAGHSSDAHLAKTGRQIVVVGSMEPTGELFEPLGPLTYSDAVQSFAEQASALAEGGVDV